MGKDYIFDEKTMEYHQKSQERLISNIENAKNSYDQAINEHAFGGSTIIITIYGLSLTWLQILQNDIGEKKLLMTFFGILILSTVIFIGLEVFLRFRISRRMTETKYLAYAYKQNIQVQFLDKFKESIQENFKDKFKTKKDINDIQEQKFYDENLKIHASIEQNQNDYITQGINEITKKFEKSQSNYELYRSILNWLFGIILMYNIILILIIYF